jgi:hypothetical protein
MQYHVVHLSYETVRYLQFFDQSRWFFSDNRTNALVFDQLLKAQAITQQINRVYASGNPARQDILRVLLSVIPTCEF